MIAHAQENRGLLELMPRDPGPGPGPGPGPKGGK
jgi:hypothetical protein